MTNDQTQTAVNSTPNIGSANNRWSQYKEVIVETYTARGSKKRKIRVRPILGQAFPQSMAVECSKSMRQVHPVGTRFRIYAKETSRKGGNPFLYSGYTWPYTIVE
jgi:hypothetical protein